MTRFLICLLLLTGVGDARYAPPADGPVPFRRDKLPVDVETMTLLSKQLVTLARSLQPDTPEARQTAARALALALALHPANRPARETDAALTAGEKISGPDQRTLEVAKSRVWQLHGWLGQPEAGDDGQALAFCLGDVLAQIDPTHPGAELVTARAVGGDWASWVAGLEDFREVEPEEPVATIEPESEAEPLPPAEPLAATTSSARFPLWTTNSATGLAELELVSLRLDAAYGDATESATLAISNDPPADPGSDPGSAGPSLEHEDPELDGALTAFLEARHGDRCRGLQLTVTFPDGYGYTLERNGRALGGVVAVMADSLFTGKPPAAAVLVSLSANGEIESPPRLWQSIRALVGQPGGRLVLPADAADLLPSLLTLDRSAFFMAHEVMLAGDAADLCDFASSSPSEPVAEAISIFAEVRAALGTRSLGSFLTYDSTRQRLSRVRTLMPEHASARVLALRGTSRWPQRLERPIFAREIRAALEAMHPHLSKKWESMQSHDIQQVADQIRTELSAIERVSGSVADRQELHAPALNLVKNFAGIALEIDRYHKSLRSGDDVRATPRRKIIECFKEYINNVQTLTAAAGDMSEYPVPSL